MIISASRRTDIPSYYSDWFINRIKERYVLVRNPMNIHQINKINLSPDFVDGIVFWTKNPIPMFDKLTLLNDYTYYFQFTITSYDKDVEPNIPSKNNHIIPAFQKLSDLIGPERIIWRYDPILLNQKYTIDYHKEYFEKIAKRIKGFSKSCTISFIDLYRNISRNIKRLDLIDLTTDKIFLLCKSLSEIAHSYDLKINTCAEKIDLSQFDIEHACCINRELFERLLGYKLNVGKDKNQRHECSCVESIDIGMYNTCLNGCRYCYANYNARIVKNNVNKHKLNSPLIIGELETNDNIKIKECRSNKDGQINLF